MQKNSTLPLNFVRLMEGKRIGLDFEDERMERYWESNQWILEPASNGIRFQCVIDDEGIRFATKEGLRSRIIEPKVPFLISELGAICKGTLLDGYLTCGNRNQTISIIEAGVDKGVEFQQEYGELSFEVCDILYENYDNICDCAVFDRKNVLREIVSESEHVRLVPSFYDKKRENYDDIRENYDTFYFKDLDYHYVNKESPRWKMFKEYKKINVVVLDVIEGDGRYAGMCGKLSIGQYRDKELVHIMNIVAGMKNEDRIRFLENRDRMIGSVVEIRALRKTAKDTFVDASFSRVVEGIDPQTCIWEE